MILPHLSLTEKFELEIIKVIMALHQIVPGRVVRLKFYPNIAVKDKYEGKSTVNFLPYTTKVFYQFNKRFNFSPLFKPQFKIDTKCLVGNSRIYSEDIKISADMSILIAQENFCRNIKRNIDIKRIKSNNNISVRVNSKYFTIISVSLLP